MYIKLILHLETRINETKQATLTQEAKLTKIIIFLG